MPLLCCTVLLQKMFLPAHAGIEENALTVQKTAGDWGKKQEKQEFTS